MAIWSAEIKELEILYTSIKVKFPDLERELEQLIETKDANVALLYSRRCLEVIITDLCKCELKRERGTEPLKGIVDKLRKEGKVPLNITTSMDHLNGLSTFGTHPKDFDPRQVKPVLNNLSTILEWYLKNKNIGIHDILLEDRKLNEERSLKLTMVNRDKLLPWSLTGFVVLIAIIFEIFRSNNIQESQPVSKYIINLPPGEVIGIDGQGSAVAFSPDGTKLCFVSKKDDINSLYLRNIDEFEAKPIPNTQNASAPFFSPDNKWLAFFADGMLKKVSILGGASQTICEARYPHGGCWGQDDNIIFGDDYYRGLMKVVSTGGKPKQITTAMLWTPGETEHSHFWPNFLPGDKTVLFTIWNNSEDMQIAAFSLETEEKVKLGILGNQAQYVKTGHLVYTWKNDLWAVPFNLNKLKVTGKPEIISNEVIIENGGVSYFYISDNGSLAYVLGNPLESGNKLSFVDHNGVSESLNIQVGLSPRISPDGKQILFSSNQEIYIYELENGILRPFTEKGYQSYWAIWTPDSKYIVYNSNRHGGMALNLFSKMSDGTGEIRQITTSDYNQQPYSISSDGKYLLYHENVHQITEIDINMIPIEGDRTPKPIINNRAFEFHPILSPDEKWLAYTSDESGREEVYVCSYPELMNKKRISNEGGMEPFWSPIKNELYYRDATGDKMMAVSFSTEPDLNFGTAKVLFEGKYKGGPRYGRNYDITADGNKFLMIEEIAATSTAKQIHVILNWSETLEEFGKTFNKNK